MLRGKWLGGLVAVAAFGATMGVVGAGTPAAADAPNVVDGYGIDVTGWRWISGRTLEVDISTASVAANAVNGAHRIRVTFPASYAQQPTERFPVLYLLHGGAGGNSAQWTTGGGDTEHITENAQLITVMPDGGKVGWFTKWVDQSQGAQDWPNFHLAQLIPWVDANFRTIATKRGRAIAGLSMGGFGAIRYAEDRPDLFAYAASFSGAVDINDPRVRGTIGEESMRAGFRPDAAFGNPFPPLDTGWTSVDPVTRAARLQGVGVALYAGSGNNPFDEIEGAMADAAAKMDQALTDLGIAHFYWNYGQPRTAPYNCDGGHNFGCWNFAFHDALPRIMAAVDSPPPPPPPPPPPAGAETIQNGGFENATSAPWACSGQCGVDRGAGLAHSGANNGWVRNTSGWNDTHQTIAVAPNSTYSVSAWVRTSTNNTAGRLGLRTAAGTVVAQQTFAALSGYTRLTFNVDSGTNSSLVFFAGITPTADTWLQVDDVSVVRVSATTTSLTSSSTSSDPDEPVTFTAVVSPAPPAGSSLSFSDGSSVLGTATTDASGTATFATSTLAPGTHSITASFGGNAYLQRSTSTAVVQVVRVPTTTGVTSSANPSVCGESVTFTAVVSPAPAAGSTVTVNDGSSVIGTGTTDESGAVAITTSTLSTGSHSITAAFGGDSTTVGSASPAVTQSVSPASTSTAAVTPSANPSVAGDPVTFSTTVVAVAPGSGTPTGIVEFFDGTTTLGTATLVGGQASLTTSALTIGTHSITAVYRGDANYSPSDSSLSPLTQTVRRRHGKPPR